MNLEIAGSFTVTTENNVYIAANFRGVVHALQKSDGQLLWSYENDPGRRIFGLALGEVQEKNSSL